MSVRTMAKVWEGSSHAGSELLMLLAIADFADDDGRAFPSITTLANKCRTTPRYAIKLLDALMASKELEVIKHGGVMGRGGKTNLYRVVLSRLNSEHSKAVNPGAVVHPSSVVNSGAGSSAPGDNEVVHQGSPKPSGNHQEPPERERSAKKQRIADDWKPDGKLVEWATQKRPDLDLSKVVEEFRDYWIAQGVARASWEATFRSWIRREKQPTSALRRGQQADFSTLNYREGVGANGCIL